MSDTRTTDEAPTADAEWAAPVSVLRRAAEAALFQESRLVLHYDGERGEYQLGVASGI